MTLISVKEKLHDYIDHADDKKIKSLYTMLQSDIEQDFELTDSDMKELDSRWEDYLSGKTKSYTLEEAMDKLKLHRAEKKKNVA